MNDDMGFTPEQIQALMSLGVTEDQLKEALGQVELGQGMEYGTPQPEGRSVGGGRVYVAANPLEHLAAGLRRYRGGQMAQDAYGRAEDLRGQQTAGRGAFWDAYKNRGQTGAGNGGLSPAQMASLSAGLR